MIQTPHGVRWLITASSCHSDNQKVFKNTYKYLVSVSVNKPPQYLWEKEAIYWTKHTIEFSNNKPHEPITPLIQWQLQNVSQHLVYIFRYPHRGNSSSLPGVQRPCNTNNRETHHITKRWSLSFLHLFNTLYNFDVRFGSKFFASYPCDSHNYTHPQIALQLEK